MYSTSSKVWVLDGGAWAGVGGLIEASGGSSGGSEAHGFGAGGRADGAGADGGAEDRCAHYWPRRSSSSLNFRPKSSSKPPSCCLVKPAMVMETISLCSGSSVTLTHRNRCSLLVYYSGLQASHMLSADDNIALAGLDGGLCCYSRLSLPCVDVDSRPNTLF